MFRVEEYAKQEVSVKQVASSSTGFLLGLFFDREHGCDMFLRNAG
jgi:hypothetical protein